MVAKQRRGGREPLLVDIAEWSVRHGFNRDPYIVGLYNAIRKKKDLALWASMDPVDLLQYPKSKAGDRFIKIAKYVGIVRNILIYIPVALTWAAVSAATTAFAIFVEQNNASTVNFLEFWQNGYGLLDHHWTIGYVARLDALIVVIVIFLSVLSHYFHEQGIFIRNKKEDFLEIARLSLAIDIKTYLFKHRFATNITLNEDLQEGVSSLLDAARELNDFSTRFNTFKESGDK